MMRETIARMWLGVVLIALSSGVLLLSDRDQHKGAGRMPRIAILQHASQPLMDDAINGMIAGLAAGGFVDGKTAVIERFNAENDLATANAIARQITSGQYDIVVTSTTRSLQAVANANKAGRVKHVFGIVADPVAAGVGISATDPLDHPQHLVGIGTALPVDKSFRLAKRLYPPLKTVGAAWNPSEANSEALTKRARVVCRELGIELVEVAVEGSSDVLQAANSLVSRGVQALWIGGDVTVIVAVDMVENAARQGRIPVFSIVPPTADCGSLFDLGANMYVVGEQTGELAARVLHGADTAKIPIRNLVPEKLVVNRNALTGLKDAWRLPDEVLRSADVVIDQTGKHEKQKR